MCLSHDLPPYTSSQKDVTDDVLVSADPPTPFNHSCEFEVGEDLGSPSELDLSITAYKEHYDKDKSKTMSLQETCMEVIEPTKLEFNDEFADNKSFSCEFADNKSFDEHFLC